MSSFKSCSGLKLPPGLEPGIFRLEGGRLIHWAMGAKKEPTEIRTRITRFKVWCANRYTMGSVGVRTRYEITVLYRLS